MGRLVAIAAGVEVVRRSYRYVELFLRVPVEISEIQRVASVGVLFPAVKGRTDVLSSREIRLRVARTHQAAEKSGGSDRDNVLLHPALLSARSSMATGAPAARRFLL